MYEESDTKFYEQVKNKFKIKFILIFQEIAILWKTKICKCLTKTQFEFDFKNDKKVN